MSRLVFLLLASLLASLASADECEGMFRLTEEGYGYTQGFLEFYCPATVDGWTMRLEFDKTYSDFLV